jgi:hypothetical protein
MDFGRRVHFVCLILSSLLFHSLAFGSPIVPASKTDWVYFDANNPPFGCFSTDMELAQALIDDADAGSTYICNARFYQWTTPWPNGEASMGAGFSYCPPAGIPANRRVQHWEHGEFEYAHEPNCTSPTEEIKKRITRQFSYYCADERYELFEPPHGSGPAIPWCRLKNDKPDPDKQRRDCCSRQGVPCEGNPIDAATGNKLQCETDYRDSGYVPLVFERHYNSMGGGDGPLGANWTHTYSRSIKRIDLSVTSSLARVHRSEWPHSHVRQHTRQLESAGRHFYAFGSHDESGGVDVYG